MSAFLLLMLGKAKAFYTLLKNIWCIELTMLVALSLLALTTWHYKSAFETEKKNFTEYISLVKHEAKLQESKNMLIENAVRETVAGEIESYRTVIKRLNVDKNNLNQKVGNLYANKTNADFRLASYADRMLLETSDISTGAESAGDPQRLAACRRELDTADTRLSVVEEACAVTTADFNLARGWIDGVCLHHKCIDKVIPNADD